MNIYRLVNSIDLTPGDRIVSAVQYHDFIVVVTEHGALFKVVVGNHDGG